ncbi:variable lymphocyte receptor A [Penaeus vannamei]|uniref:Variable lymphocyte receptor A n=1 Tax=Penaeus vannamei TaxID=6689 RepID=A0A423T0N6_PENVA|nr:variable lymphocyte receptor A [Penaeus vannamei]
MICTTYLLIPVCLALTAATPLEDSNRALSEASDTEITPSRPPEDLILEDDAEEAPGAEETPGTTGSSFLANARQNNSTFSKSTTNVTGITAAGPECRLENLELLAGYVLNEDLLDKCKNLRNVTLAGSYWKCVGNLSRFVEALGDRVSYEKALCADIKCTSYLEHKSCELVTGMNITKMYSIKEDECPAICACSLRLWNGEFWYTVNCAELNITDETLPSFPPGTTNLILSQNQLRSTRRLFASLKELKNLLIVYLGDNQLDSLPYFHAGSFTKLKQIFLNNNNIKQLDDEAVKSMVDVNENFRVGLFGNPIVCGEEIKKINVLQLSNYFEYFVKFYMKAAPLARFEFDPLIMYLCFLCAMNVFLVYVIYDLWMAKREMRKTMTARRPLLDRILSGLTVGCRALYSRSFWRPEEESKGSTDAFYKSPDQVAIRKRTPKAARANASETDVP